MKSQKRAGHVVSQRLRHHQPNTEDDGAMGHLEGGDEIPKPPRAVEREATTDTDDFWSIADDAVCYSRVTVPNPSEVYQRKPTDKTNLDNLEESNFDAYWNAEDHRTLRRLDRVHSFPVSHKKFTKCPQMAEWKSD